MANKIQFEYNIKSKKELKEYCKPYPKQFIESFVCYLGINGFENNIELIDRLAKEHKDLYHE